MPEVEKGDVVRPREQLDALSRNARAAVVAVGPRSKGSKEEEAKPAFHATYAGDGPDGPARLALAKPTSRTQVHGGRARRER